ncbi:MAG: hypothetical protein DRI34_12660 [Deltaproteobacteria bacterium]|nr:MAG: hypothetical protein DRI34_12660 [Deltaproteobacteria bacterium]
MAGKAMKRLPVKIVLVALLVAAGGPSLRAQMFNVTFLHTPPAQVVEGKAIEIAGNIIGADQVSIAALLFRRQGGSEYEVRELSLVSGDRYRGTIPAKFVKPPGVEYYCYAVDFEGNKHVVFASEKKPQFIKVVSLEQAARRQGVKLPPQVKPAPPPAAGKEKPADADREPAAADPDCLAAGAAGPLSRSPLVETVVTREQIVAGGWRTLAEVLDRLAGLTVSRTVSGGYRLALRGVPAGPEVLLLLDGQPLSNPYDGRLLLEFPAAAIERVEVLREPAAGLHGAGALQGVIDVRTRRQAQPGGSVAWGRFNDVLAATGGGLEGENFAVGGQLQFFYTAGQDRQVDSDVLTGVGDDDPGHDVSNTPGPVDDGRLQLHAQTRGRVGRLGGGELDWLARYFWQRRGALVGKYDSLDNGSRLGLHLVQVQAGYRLAVLEQLDLLARIFFDGRWSDEAFQVISGDNDTKYQAEGPDGPVRLDDGLRESLATAIYQVLGRLGSEWRPLPGNSLLFGVDVGYTLLEEMTLQRSTGTTPCPQQGLLIQGYLLECGSRDGPGAGRDRLLVSTSLRDTWRDAGLQGLDFLAAFRLDWASDYGLALGPQVALVYNPVDWFGVRTSYSMSYRAPTLQELYEDAAFDPVRGTAGNPRLEPVRNHHWSLGLQSRLGQGRLRARLAAAFFLTWLRSNIIGLDPGGSAPSYQNDEALDIMGCELEADFRFGRRSHLWMNGSWFRASVHASGQARSSYLTDSPQLRFNLGLDVELADWLNLYLDVRLGAERRNNVRRPLEMLHAFRIPAYSLLRVGLFTQPLLFGHLGFFAYADNLLGQDMRDPAPRPDRLPGLIPVQPFTFLVGARWMP